MLQKVDPTQKMYPTKINNTQKMNFLNQREKPGPKKKDRFLEKIDSPITKLPQLQQVRDMEVEIK